MSKRKTAKNEVPKADQSPEEPPKKRSKAKAKETAPTEPYVDEQGWNIHPPSLIYKSWKFKPAAKIAAFDLDGTLVVTKGGREFPTSADDWKFFNKKVASKVQEYVEKGFQFVVFSNQGGIKSKLDGAMAKKIAGRMEQVVAKLDVPAVVLMATLTDEFRKPEVGMWKFFVENLNGGKTPDLKTSFFVGDAAGREGDIGDSDKAFAESIGLAFKTPEEVFGEGDRKKTFVTTPGTYSSANDDLVHVFNTLAENNEKEGKGFQARAFRNVATTLSTYPKKVDDITLPEVKKLKGVGKGSLAVIQEWLTTGTVEGLGESGAQVAAASKQSKTATDKAKSEAMKFM